jgi:serine/threonine protein kinase/tetratricopeptide (TPR) repeat protein
VREIDANGALSYERIETMNEQSLFIAVLERDPSERRAFLDSACAGNASLRGRVEKLLLAHENAANFMERPAAAQGTTIDEAISERPGTVIGPYRLMEQIGEGGFGVVFMAEQQEPIRRKVALKVLKPGMETKQVIARFEAERQALALMDHPNIAKVLDAGQTSSGRPYFVMDLVKGIPITEYCDQKQLSLRERLELFVHICQAVQHAHQKGIIHRDLKPTNVLVTLQDGSPLVKVIDFGIAKALGQQLTDKTLFTGFAQLIGTPLYMSPEQAALSNVDVDTRSDIYSLGVLLYELLIGTTPFDKERLRTVGYDEMRRIIREEEPPTPSTRISTLGEVATVISTQRKSDPKRLRQLLRGELDWIVMKALEKDRDRRYETVSALAADVQRYLHDEPVQACPPSAWYRYRKFARRNKGPMLAASLILLALISGVVSTSLGLREARRQRDAADANAERADEGFAKAKEAVEQYLRAVTNDPDLKNKHDLHALRKKLLDAAVPFYQWFPRQKPGESAVEAERGRAYWRLALVRSEMGEKEAALKDYERAQTIFGQLVANFPAVPEYRKELARSLNNLGLLLRDLGQRSAAEQAYRRALEIKEKLAADFPTVPDYRHELASTFNNLGILLRDLGQWAAAENAWRRALEIREKLAADFPTVPDYRQELATSLNNLGVLLRDLGQWAAAENAWRRTLEIRKKVAADFPTVPQARLELAGSHHNLGVVLKESGQLPAAEQSYRRALEIQERLVADFATVPQYRQELAWTHNSLGLLLRGMGHWPAAEQAYRRALDIREKLAADVATVPQYRLELARSHTNLGLLLADMGQRPAAEQAYRRALDIHEKLAADFPTVPQYHLDLAGSYVNFGNLLRDHEQAEVSLDWYAKAIARLVPLVQQEPRLVTERLYLRNAHWGRAQALDKLARHAEAVKDWDRALALNSLAVDKPRLRCGRALSLAYAGEHGKAVIEANALAEAKDITGATLYDLGCVCALAAAVKDNRKRQEEYAARAVAMLRLAVGRGYNDAAHMKEDKDLDALRDREDFKKLLAELEAGRGKK